MRSSHPPKTPSLKPQPSPADPPSLVLPPTWLTILGFLQRSSFFSSTHREASDFRRPSASTSSHQAEEQSSVIFSKSSSPTP